MEKINTDYREQNLQVTHSEHKPKVFQVWPVPCVCAQPYDPGSVLFLPDGYAIMISPNKAETAVHGCHCPDDMAVRMRKVLDSPWVGA